MASGPKRGAGNTPRPWVIYTRVSTDEQAKQGTSLEAQEAGCRALATAYGHPVSEVLVDDGYSAAVLKRKGRRALDAFLKRPAARRLLELVEAGAIGGVIVWKLNRLVRNTRQLLEVLELMADRGVAFTSVNDRIDTSTAMGRMVTTIVGAIDQLESEQISERVVAVLDYMRSQGRWTGGTLPAGLRVEVRNGKERYLVADPTWGPVVAKAWPMVIAGSSLRQVADFFTRERVPLKSGKRWAMPALLKLLKRQHYVGVLVDRETFLAAHRALASRVSPASRKAGHVAPADDPAAPVMRRKMMLATTRVWRLQEVARCARCGSSLAGVTARGRGGEYAYLRCIGRVRRGRAYCDSRDLPAREWEDAVVRRLAEYVADPEKDLGRAIAALVARHLAEAAPLRAQRDAAQLERDRAGADLARAMDLAMAGGAMARAFADRITGLQERVEQLDVQLATLEGRLAASETTAEQVEAIADAIREEVVRLPEQPWDVQKRQLAQVVVSVELASGLPGRIRLAMPDVLGKPAPIPGHLGAANAAAAGGSGGGAMVRTKVREWLRGVTAVRTNETIDIPFVPIELRARRRGGAIQVQLVAPGSQSQPAPDRVE
jgi:site-specific DNA recombinase